MDSPSDNVRIGCVWTVINLIVTEETLDARGSSLYSLAYFKLNAETEQLFYAIWVYSTSW
jgi:hypothetical protein